MHRIYEGENINHDQVEMARLAGLSLHHEVEYETQRVNVLDENGDPVLELDPETGEWEEVYEDEEVCTRDEWYAAAPGWVIEYKQNGGTWGYND